MDSIVLEYIKQISKEENINLNKFLDKYYKKLERCFRVYKNNYGLEDYKMNYIDFIILYNIWSNLDRRGCIESYLLIMYSYYKLEDFNFPTRKFKSGLDCIPIIQNTNTISIINSFLAV